MTVEKLTDKLVEIATSLQGPGFEAAKGAASVDAMSTLSSGVICGVLAGLCAWASRAAWRRFMKEDASDEVHLGAFVVLIVCGMTGALLCARAVWAFADPWTWVALTQPELWLAKRALGL